MTYDNNTETWFACSENIIGSNGDETYPEASKPRIWPMKLNFTSASFEFVRQEGDEAVVVAVDPTPGTSTSKSTLKLEDIAAVPTYDPLLQDIWLVSEAHSRLMKTNIFLSKDFGAPDLSSFDPDTYSNSRLVRIDGISGGIIEEVALPNFTQWDGNYNWDGRYVKYWFSQRHYLFLVYNTIKYEHALIIINLDCFFLFVRLSYSYQKVNASEIVHSKEPSHWH